MLSSLEDACNPFFFSRPDLIAPKPISDCTSLIPTNFSFATYFAGYKSTSNPTTSSSSPTFDYSLASSLVRRKHLTFYDFHDHHDHDWNFWVNFVRIWTNWGLSTPQLRRPRILSGWSPFCNNWELDLRLGTPATPSPSIGPYPLKMRKPFARYTLSLSLTGNSIFCLPRNNRCRPSLIKRLRWRERWLRFHNVEKIE